MIHVKITANKYVTADFAVRMARRSDTRFDVPKGRHTTINYR